MMSGASSGLTWPIHNDYQTVWSPCFILLKNEEVAIERQSPQDFLFLVMRAKKGLSIFFILVILTGNRLCSQNRLDSILPIRGFSIAAPTPSYVDSFVLFIENELAPRNVNTLLLRVDYNYQYKSHPELRDSIALN